MLDEIMRARDAFCKATGGIPPRKIIITQETLDLIKDELVSSGTMIYPAPEDCGKLFGMLIDVVEERDKVIARITGD